MVSLRATLHPVVMVYKCFAYLKVSCSNSAHSKWNFLTLSTIQIYNPPLSVEGNKELVMLKLLMESVDNNSAPSCRDATFAKKVKSLSHRVHLLCNILLYNLKDISSNVKSDTATKTNLINIIVVLISFYHQSIFIHNT